jgi:hypothetical protein
MKSEVEWSSPIIEKINSKNYKVNNTPMYKRGPNDKYHKVEWFDNLNLAIKFAQKVKHKEKIIVIEDAEYILKNNGSTDNIKYINLWFGIRVSNKKDLGMPSQHK